MPNNKRILVPQKRVVAFQMIREGKTNEEIREVLGRPELDVDWFRTWAQDLTKCVLP